MKNWFHSVEYFIKRDPLSSWAQNVPKLLKSVERFEEEVFDTAEDEVP